MRRLRSRLGKKLWKRDRRETQSGEDSERRDRGKTEENRERGKD
jgi:hypothetical protein